MLKLKLAKCALYLGNIWHNRGNDHLEEMKRCYAEMKDIGEEQFFLNLRFCYHRACCHVSTCAVNACLKVIDVLVPD